MDFQLGEIAQVYLSMIADNNQNTADTYTVKFRIFRDYLKKNDKGDIDNAVKMLKAKELDPYIILAGLASFVLEQGRAASYQHATVKTIKNFLEYNDIEISAHKFRLKVRLKKAVDKEKLGLSKQDVYEILRGCEDSLRLLTFVLFLAATGTRASEALHLRLKNLHLDDPKQPYVFINGEFTKTKKDRTVYLTHELVSQLKKYIEWKYRVRRSRYIDRKPIYAKWQPKYNEDDYVFIPYHHEGEPLPDIESVYIDLSYRFARMLERIGKGQYEDGNTGRHKITFHSFRRFVKTTISDLGYADYSEYFIGHAGSTYYRKPEKERIELFHKIEPYLTFMDVVRLEAKGADMATKLEASEMRYQRLQEQSALMMAYMMEQDPGKKAEISKQLIAKGYMPKGI